MNTSSFFELSDEVNSTGMASNATSLLDLELSAIYYKNLSIVIEKIFIPVLCITGTIGNILTILVLGKKKNRSSPVSVVLLFLSISDSFVLFTGYFTQWMNLLWSVRIRAINNVACKVHVFLTYFSLQLSSWLLVLITSERAFSVMSPHKAKLVCDRRKTLIVIAITAVLLLLLNGHFFYGMTIIVDENINHCYYADESYLNFITTTWIWVDFFVTFAVPIVFIGAGNALIIFEMKRNERKRQHLVVQRTNSDPGSETNINSITRLLIFLSVIFAICSGPSSIINVMLSYLLKAGDEYQDLILLFVRQMAFLFSGLNATLNFFLYILSGTKFREEVKALLCFKWTKEHVLSLGESSQYALRKLSIGGSRQGTMNILGGSNQALDSRTCTDL